MEKNYKYGLLRTILDLKVNGKAVWKKRVQQQTQYINLLEDNFSTGLIAESFGFYPNKIYFGTPLTTDLEYTRKMKPTWLNIIKAVEKLGWQVYAPFTKTDPHAKIPDKLDSYGIRDLDHIQVLTAEVALFDLNRPSHGVGQEIEMSVFMPTIGFSQSRVSRLTKGMPGTIILNYKDKKELVNLLVKTFERESFKKQPFYLNSCPNHPTKSIFKGNQCLNCYLSFFSHKI